MSSTPSSAKKTLSILISSFLVLPSLTPLYAQVVTQAPVTAEPIMPVNAAPLQFSAFQAAVPASLSLPSMKGGLALTSLSPAKSLAVGGSVAAASGVRMAASAQGVPALQLQGRSAASASVRDLNGLNASAADEKKVEPGIRSRYDGSAPAVGSSLIASQAQSTGFLGSLLGSLFSRFRKPVETPLQEGHANLYEVPAVKLRYIPNPADLKATKDIGESPARIVGQDRAMEALRFSVEMEGQGYNVFVTGPDGSGRLTAAQQVLKEVASKQKGGGDLIQVRDFSDPENLKVLSLPAGEGEAFKATVDGAIEQLKTDIPQIIKEVQANIGSAADRLNEVTMTELQALEAKAAAVRIEGAPGFGVALGQSQKGAWKIVPTYRGKVITPEVIQTIEIAPQDLQKAAKAQMKAKEELETELEQIVEMNQKMGKEINDGAKQQIKERVEAKFNELTAAAAAQGGEDVKAYLKSAAAFAKEHFGGLAKSDEEDEPRPQMGGLAALMGGAVKSIPVSQFFEVESLVASAQKTGAPVVYEKFPSYENVFGTIEERPDGKGGSKKHIKPGAILKANGGYLLLNAWDAAREPGVLQELIKALKNGEIEITDEIPGKIRIGARTAAHREKVKVALKVVLIGDGQLLGMLSHYLPDFPELFHGRSQFDRTMENNTQNLASYAEILSRLIREGSENLIHMNAAAVGKVVEFAAWLAGDQKKLTVQFRDVRNVIREATYFARKAGAAEVGAEHVKTALVKRLERTDLRKRKMQEMIVREMFKISTSGQEVGQINALAVTGDYETAGREDVVRQALGVDASRARYGEKEAGLSLESRYGVVMRVTAVHGKSGSTGISWTDKNAGLIGPIATKALDNISGFIMGRFSSKIPLRAAVSISFEQEYSGIEGDSASVAKTLSVLSSLSGIALRQDLAVTGSLNQKGEVQVIGGVNDKIEGFFDLCKARGLTGTQGVVVPEGNLEDLQLRDDILEAVKAGKFHIYGVRTIDEAVEIFTGVRAGQQDPKTKAFPAGTVNAKVAARLVELAKAGGK